MGQVSISIVTKTKKTPIENKLGSQLAAAGIAGYRRNARFVPDRRFEADFYFPALRLAVEVDGGVWLGRRGGHTSGVGYSSDRKRDQMALAHGIITLRFTSQQIKDGQAIAYLKEYIPVRRRQVGAEGSNNEFCFQLPESYRP
jgi:very-short-patch-repair endonuclease